MRQRIYDILTQPARTDVLGRAISYGLLLVIAVNVTASILVTDANIAASAPVLFRTVAHVSVAVFTVEYLLRLWSAGSRPEYFSFGGRIRFALHPMMVIDLLSIAPFYVEMLFPGTIDLSFLRVLRLMRIFRLLDAGPLRTAFGRIVRVARAKRTELAVSFVFILVAMMLAAGAMYWVEQDEPNTAFTSIPRAMWWSLVTITTIGYGDMTPTSPLGQFVAGFVAFLGICAVALPVGIVSSGYIDEINTAKRDEFCPHCHAKLHAPVE